MADHSPKFKPGQDITLTAGAAITGKQLLSVSTAADNTVVPTSAASSTWIGVARQDTVSGDKVVVARGGVHTLIASGAITRGSRVVAAAAGAVASIGATDEDLTVGTALTSAVNNLVLVALDR